VNVNWLWLILGIIAGAFVIPRLRGMV